MARLKEEIAVGEGGPVDGEEDERYGEEMRGDELPAELQRIRGGWRRRNGRAMMRAVARPARAAIPRD